MKVPPIPQISISITIGGETMGAPVTKPSVDPETIKQRLANLRKGREGKKAAFDVYPKVVPNNSTPEGKDLKPKPRMGYYR